MNAHSAPPRIRERPDPALWGGSELLTLPEAAALWWPSGPLSVKSLRNAIRSGQLGHVRIARKLFVTPDALKEMCRCVPPTSARPEPAPAAPAASASPSPDVAALLREIGLPRGRPRARAAPA